MKPEAPKPAEVALPGEGASGFAQLLPPVPAAENPLADTPKALKKRDLEAMEDALYQQATDILHGTQLAPDLPIELGDQMLPEPPAKWIDEYGSEKAWRLFRAAKAAWSSKKDAPMFITVAMGVHGAITKARATRDQGPAGTLQVAFITQHNYNYQEQELDEDDGH